MAHDWLTIVPVFSDDPEATRPSRATRSPPPCATTNPTKQVYVCGPPAMLADARRWLPLAGVPADHLHLPDPVRGWVGG